MTIILITIAVPLAALGALFCMAAGTASEKEEQGVLYVALAIGAILLFTSHAIMVMV